MSIPSNAANLKLATSDTGYGTPTSATSWKPSTPYPTYSTDPLSAAGDFFGIGSAARANNFQAAYDAWAAQNQREFEEYMSNTAIQRRMADLKAAGLNPLLAVQSASSGASTPSASATTMSAKADSGEGSKMIQSLAKIVSIIAMIVAMA